MIILFSRENSALFSLNSSVRNKTEAKAHSQHENKSNTVCMQKRKMFTWPKRTRWLGVLSNSLSLKTRHAEILEHGIRGKLWEGRQRLQLGWGMYVPDSQVNRHIHHTYTYMRCIHAHVISVHSPSDLCPTWLKRCRRCLWPRMLLTWITLVPISEKTVQNFNSTFLPSLNSLSGLHQSLAFTFSCF